jgi:hypothetical protein
MVRVNVPFFTLEDDDVTAPGDYGSPGALRRVDAAQCVSAVC